MYHVICSCPVLAPTLYLNMRHNQVAKILYQEAIRNDNLIKDPPEVTEIDNLKIWWNMSIRTTPKLEKRLYGTLKQKSAKSLK